MTSNELLSFEGEDGQLAAGIKDNELRSDESNDHDPRRGSGALELEDGMRAALTEDIDLSSAIFALTGANGEKRLDWVIGKGGDLGINSIDSKLP